MPCAEFGASRPENDVEGTIAENWKTVGSRDTVLWSAFASYATSDNNLTEKVFSWKTQQKKKIFIN